jgi:bifunctional DNA-binding transcriptional regulator/antitoxin component of YhaV-PrlF toxin-antitoxin module
MDTIELVYEGKDLTIPSETLEELGIKKGEKVEIRTVKHIRKNPSLEPANFSKEEKARRETILKETWGAWTKEEGEAAEKAIRELRAEWQPRNL